MLGAPSGFEGMLIKCAWTKYDNGAQVIVGGGDRSVTVFDVSSGKIEYKLGGHKGSVGAVDTHPREPISESIFVCVVCSAPLLPPSGEYADLAVPLTVLTGSVDKNMLLGELDIADMS